MGKCRMDTHQFGLENQWNLILGPEYHSFISCCFISMNSYIRLYIFHFKIYFHEHLHCLYIYSHPWIFWEKNFFGNTNKIITVERQILTIITFLFNYSEYLFTKSCDCEIIFHQELNETLIYQTNALFIS